MSETFVFKPDIVNPENISTKEIAAIDTAIGKANAYYINKYYPERPKILLYWTPCSGSTHSDPLWYFLVWGCDETKMNYGHVGKIPAYFLFKGMLDMWEGHYGSSEKLDELEKYVLE